MSIQTVANALSPYALNSNALAPAALQSEDSALGLQPVSTPDITIPLLSDSIGSIPVFTVVPEPVFLPAAPEWDVGNAPALSGDFTPVELPDEPVYTLPSVPVFDPIVIPAVPPLDSVVFDGAMVPYLLTLPTEGVVFIEGEYSSAMLDAIELEIQSELYGIVDSDENVEWQRLRGKLVRAAVDKTRAAMSDSAARGFCAPPGALFAAHDATLRELSAQSSDLNAKLTEQRADKHTDMTRLGTTTAIAASNLRQRAHDSRMTRSLEAEQARCDTALSLYKAGVDKYNLDYESYRTNARVYEARIGAIKLQLDAYKTAVEAQFIGAEIQKMYADIYKAELEGFKTYVNIYKTQMEASQIALSIERLKLDAYKAKVDAYTAQVGSKEAEARLYEVTISGEMSKITLYQAEVSALGTQVEAYKSKIQAEQITTNSQLAENKLKLEARRSSISGYTAELGYWKGLAGNTIGAFTGETSEYRARTSANVELASAGAQTSVADAQIIMANDSLAFDYTLQTRALALANAKITSASAIGTSAIASANYINDLKNASAAAINAARNTGAEELVTMKIEARENIAVLNNASQLRIALWRSNQEINLSDVRSASSDFLNDWRNNHTAAVNNMAYILADVEMDRVNAQRIASITLNRP